jgi:VanZ family protein
MTLRTLWWVLGGVIVTAAVAVCLVPNDDLPRSFSLNDKVSHVLGHALMAGYFSGLVARGRWWKIFVFQLLLGAGIEVAQSAMHVGRQADLTDVLANCVGAGLGLLAGRLGVERWPRAAAWVLGQRAVS